MKERWADVKGYGGAYQVSDAGEVRRIAGVSIDGKKRAKLKYRLMRGKVVKNGGRRQVHLSWDGVDEYKYVSRLVAEAFVPNPDGLRSVIHINGDQLDDRACNLAWADQPTNAAEGWSRERSVPVTRDDGARYESMTSAARDMAVSVSTVRSAAETGGACAGHRMARSDGGPARGGGRSAAKRGVRVERVTDLDGGKLKRIMTEARVSVRRLAADSGVSETKIWRMRSGKENPRPDELERIADFLGVEASDLRRGAC